MLWRKVSKIGVRKPKKGNTYRDWKPHLAKEGHHQCVYCAIHESRFGGQRNFHVEHFRPKSRFEKLENNYQNLFYACAICNSFKGDDWPGEPARNHAKLAYPEISTIELTRWINVDWLSGFADGRVTSTRYLVERVYLNRPQLLLERRATHLRHKFRDFKVFATRATRQLIKEGNVPLLGELAVALANVATAFDTFSTVIPYAPHDVTRS
jgi:5-methylcytosine-specific restriction endonuclease McrA